MRSGSQNPHHAANGHLHPTGTKSSRAAYPTQRTPLTLELCDILHERSAASRAVLQSHVTILQACILLHYSSAGFEFGEVLSQRRLRPASD